MFEFFDYNRTVVAYHGTSEIHADRLVCGDPFKPSGNVYDWLGGGIYFWEYAPRQAWRWATRYKKLGQPAVVGAMIRLGNCLDLLDPENVQWLKQIHADMIGKWRQIDASVPQNGNQHKNLDCAIFNHCYRIADDTGAPVDTTRAVYVPTECAKRVWTRSWLYEEAHIQLCVRNAQNILAVWHVGRDGRYGKRQGDA